MNPLTIPPANAAPADQDLADQANPGHGIPSQDPNAGAQTPLEPHEAEREADQRFGGDHPRFALEPDVAQRTNDIMRVLTVFSAIILPLSLVAGILLIARHMYFYMCVLQRSSRLHRAQGGHDDNHAALVIASTWANGSARSRIRAWIRSNRASRSATGSSLD